MTNHLPYLTGDLPGIGGRIKTIPADFLVEEIPLYEAGGEGQHIYLTFEKEGLTTLKVINMIAGALNINRRDIGYAGLKDAQAITRQTISIDSVPLDQVTKLNLPNVKILAVKRHRNKLKLGHLKGNRFVIRIRQVEPAALPLVDAVVERLYQQGVPNYFGQQRFGLRDNSHLLGLALVQGNISEFMAEFLGKPHPKENLQAQYARSVFDAGNWEEALAAWPSMLREEQLVLQKLVRTGDMSVALEALDRRVKRLFVSACQSRFFNQLLAERLDRLNRIETGDVAYIHGKGACFVVEDAAVEQPRVDAFEISPAGPMFGEKCLLAAGEPGIREKRILENAGISPADFNVPGVNLEGSRRPYRIPLKDVAMKWDDGLVISFVLPPGAYATMVLHEIMKDDIDLPEEERE